MRLALVTTTVHIPEVLRLYRRYGPDVQMFVAADDKTPAGAVRVCGEIGARLLRPEVDDDQWKCSRLIGRNTIGRRSIAILEALQWGADVIVSIDDDNNPMDCLYFNEFKEILNEPFNGLQAGATTWFDYGQWLSPPARQRGIPAGHEYPGGITFATGAKIGVAQGICLGDPDTDALTRLQGGPTVHQPSELLRAGVVVHPDARTVFNTQNTAFIRELAPCFLMVPQLGRYDDIFASLICRRIMRETGHYLYLGKPFCWQARNTHNFMVDLQNEMWGMQHVVAFTEWLDGFDLPDSVLGSVRYIYEHATDFAWMPADVSELGLAWCDDVVSVL
jgi:hypothetical protein